MSNNRIFRIAAVAAAVGAVAATAVATDAFGASAHGAGAAAVKLASVNVGSGSSKLLVDASGHPIYLLTGDSVKQPLCTSSDCLEDWPAVTSTSAKPALGAGIKGKLTVWNHSGLHQLVLSGHPLYRFADDSGSTAKGQDLKSFGGTWELMTANGGGFTGSASNGSSSHSTSTSGSGW